MSAKIRLQRHGSKKRPFYFIVVADSRSPRDGKFIQKLGTYNPLTIPATVQLDRQKALEWLNKGATPTETAQHEQQIKKRDEDNQRKRREKRQSVLAEAAAKKVVVAAPAEETAPAAEEASGEEA